VRRSELLHMKHSGLPREFSDWVQKNILDHGHEVEKLARPLVEALIGDVLYPVTCSDGKQSASCDGLTLGNEIALEHKQWSEALAASVRAGIVPDEHMPQCQQVLKVTRAGKLIFVVSDGTAENMVYAWVYPELEWFERINAGWAQFERDLAAYVPPVAAEPAPVGKAPETLPALRIEITGMVTASNLAEFKQTALNAIHSVNRDLKTDNDFASAEKAVKWCEDVESRLDAAKQHALSQTATIDELFRTIDDISAEARRVRLDLNKLVTARKAAIKLEIVQEGKAAYEAHEAALRAECGPWKVLAQPDFAGCIKNLRTVESIRNAVQTTLANAKIKADESAREIRSAMAALDDESKGFEHLFSDRLSFISMSPDAVRLTVRDRIAKHREAEQARAAALAEKERERIRAEEASRLQREQAAREAEERRRLQEQEAATARAPAAIEAERLAQAAPVAAPASVAPPAVVQFAARRPAPAAVNEPATLNIGAISQRLGFTVSAAFIADTLGIQPAATDKAAKLYREGQFPLICSALVSHIAAIQQKHAA
jgi:predicted phage-related endonuclease